MAESMELLTIDEAAKLVGRTRMTIYNCLSGKGGDIEYEIDQDRQGQYGLGLIMVKKASLIETAIRRGWIERETDGDV